MVIRFPSKSQTIISGIVNLTFFLSMKEDQEALREKRRAKIKANSNSRLNRIINLQSNPDAKESSRGEVSQDVGDKEQMEQSVTFDGIEEIKKDQIPKEAPSITTVPPIQSSIEELFNKEILNQINETKSTQNDTNIPLVNPLVWDFTWTHATIMTTVTIAAFLWNIANIHSLFHTGSPLKDLCRQFDWMATNHVHTEVSSSYHIQNYPFWTIFFTLELSLLVFRFVNVRIQFMT